MENHLHFNSLLIISFLAFIIPLMVNEIKFIKIPVVIAEIAIGIIVGQSGFNLIQHDLWIEFLSLFGFAYLMFLSGVEIDFSYLKRGQNSFQKQEVKPLYLGSIIFILTTLLSFIFASVLLKMGIIKNPLLVMLIFSTTSLGIVVPILKEKQIVNEAIGQTLLIAALIADFATMLILPIVMFFVEARNDITLIFPLFIFVIFGFLYFLGRRVFKFKFDNPTLETSQIKVRAAFALVLVFVTIAEMTKTEFILGAFLAGVLFSLLFKQFHTEIAPKLDAIGYGFLIPIFFITVGAKLNLTTVFSPETLLNLPIFILIAYLVKLLPALILKKYFNWPETIGAGFLLSSRLSLIIAISLIALKAGVIDEATHSTFILTAIVTCLISPVVFNRIFPPRIKKKDHIILAGNSEVILSVAKRIAKEEIIFILIESSEQIRQRFLRMEELECIFLNKLIPENLAEIPELNLTACVAFYDNDHKNQEICEMARSLAIKNIIAVMNDPANSAKLENLEVRVITQIKAVYTLLYEYLKYPESFQVMYGAEDDDNIEIREIKLYEYMTVVGVKIKRLRLPGDCLILLIARSGKRIVPDGNTRLEKGDVVVVMGNKEYMKAINDFFS